MPALKTTLTRWQAAAKQGAADLQNVDEAAHSLRDAQAEVDIAAAEASVAKHKVEQLRALQQRHELRAPEAATTFWRCIANEQAADKPVFCRFAGRSAFLTRRSKL